jgi:hypothetical protein
MMHGNHGRGPWQALPQEVRARVLERRRWYVTGEIRWSRGARDPARRANSWC